MIDAVIKKCVGEVQLTAKAHIARRQSLSDYMNEIYPNVDARVLANILELGYVYELYYMPNSDDKTYYVIGTTIETVCRDALQHIEELRK